MKLIIHPGLHKTGSTYLQHVLNDNHEGLAEQGIYYQRQDSYPAHHHTAWQVLEGKPDPLIAMIEQAEELGSDAVIFSSEDLEGALFEDRPLRAIDQAVAHTAIETVEWHVVLRDPGACFASLFAQLQHHVYADAFQLFYDVMRRGFIHLSEPTPNAGTPFWYYCFDQARDLARLERRTGAIIHAHDFAAQSPFPGASILRHLGALDAIQTLPQDAARNARPDRDDIIRGFVSRVAEAVPEDADQERILDGFLNCLENGLENSSAYAEIVGRQFASSHADALARFAASGVSPPQDQLVEPAE
ncbi:MAG: hypothetical protein ABJP48_07580 [Erythrobacter sp.]